MMETCDGFGGLKTKRKTGESLRKEKEPWKKKNPVSGPQQAQGRWLTLQKALHMYYYYYCK